MRLLGLRRTPKALTQKKLDRRHTLRKSGTRTSTRCFLPQSVHAVVIHISLVARRRTTSAGSSQGEYVAGKYAPSHPWRVFAGLSRHLEHSMSMRVRHPNTRRPPLAAGETRPRTGAAGSPWRIVR
jgi:hypothetical protein